MDYFINKKKAKEIEKEKNNTSICDNQKKNKVEKKSLKVITFINITDNKIEIASKILKKSKILLIVNENQNIYYKIYLGDNEISISYNNLIEIKELSNRIKEDNKYYIIAENYIKFFEFLKEVEKRIRNELFFKYTFEILLKFNREDEENSNASRIYNITCI